MHTYIQTYLHNYQHTCNTNIPAYLHSAYLPGCIAGYLPTHLPIRTYLRAIQTYALQCLHASIPVWLITCVHSEKLTAATCGWYSKYLQAGRLSIAVTILSGTSLKNVFMFRRTQAWCPCDFTGPCENTAERVRGGVSQEFGQGGAFFRLQGLGRERTVVSFRVVYTMCSCSVTLNPISPKS